MTVTETKILTSNPNKYTESCTEVSIIPGGDLLRPRARVWASAPYESPHLPSQRAKIITEFMPTGPHCAFFEEHRMTLRRLWKASCYTHLNQKMAVTLKQSSGIKSKTKTQSLAQTVR